MRRINICDDVDLCNNNYEFESILNPNPYPNIKDCDIGCSSKVLAYFNAGYDLNFIKNVSDIIYTRYITFCDGSVHNTSAYSSVRANNCDPKYVLPNIAKYETEKYLGAIIRNGNYNIAFYRLYWPSETHAYISMRSGYVYGITNEELNNLKLIIKDHHIMVKTLNDRILLNYDICQEHDFFKIKNIFIM